MKFVSLLAALSVISLLASCTSTSQISLTYVPEQGRITPGRAEFATRAFSDRRGEPEANFLGTVRTQIGTPLERLYLRGSAADVVTNAVGHGLQARGMLTSPNSARYIITGDVLDLYCQMLVHPNGYARIRVKVVDAGSGQILFNRVFEGQRTGNAYIPGSGSPVPNLIFLTSGALQDAVDRALDDAAFRALVENVPPPLPPTGYGAGATPAYPGSGTGPAYIDPAQDPGAYRRNQNQSLTPRPSAPAYPQAPSTNPSPNPAPPRYPAGTL